MNQATGWASDVINAFQHGTLTAAELWDILLHHVDDAHADQSVSRLLGRFKSLLDPTATEEFLVIEDLP